MKEGQQWIIQDIWSIRTGDEVKDWIRSEIQQGRLRQGWGIPGTQLIENNITVDVNTWKDRYKDGALRHWNHNADDNEATKRYWIIYPMTELNEGDIIVVPKMPTYDKFTILKVGAGYEFDFAPVDERGNEDDFRHIVHIDKENMRVFSYSSSLEAKIVHKKMRAYQSAVNNVWNNEFISAVDSLLQQKPIQSDIQSRATTELFGDIKSSILKEMLTKLRGLTPKDLEELIAKTFENAGYAIFDRNLYDGKGGDADIILTRSMPLISNYTEMDLKIYIQVKQKSPIDYDDIDGVNQLVKISVNDKNSIKILMSTVDKFTDQCRALAEESNVILMSGQQLVEVLIKYL